MKKYIPAQVEVAKLTEADILSASPEQGTTTEPGTDYWEGELSPD